MPFFSMLMSWNLAGLSKSTSKIGPEISDQYLEDSLQNNLLNDAIYQSL